MLPALLATICFACSAVCGQRLSRLLGGISANHWRLALAFAVLVVLTVALFPRSLHVETVGWYVVSGAIGFGVGDVALFLAYPHLGSRLTVLVLMSFAVFFGAIGDRWLLHTPLTWPLAGCIAIILGGLLLALHRPGEPWRWGRGFGFAVIAGWGQGFGAVLSRIAQARATAGGFDVPAISQTAQRAAGGMVITVAAYAIVLAVKRRNPSAIPPPSRRKNLGLWLIGSALFGPVIGVSAMQWALASLHSSALVIAITATAPLLIIPLARWIEKERTSPRAIFGTALAVVGVALVSWVR